MPHREIRILLVEDDQDDTLLIKEYLQEIPNYKFVVEWEPRSDKAREKLLNPEFDLFLIDYNLGKETGISLIRHARSQGMVTPAILLTGLGDSNIDLDASSAGAFDYLTKNDLSAAILERSIRYALSQANFVIELNKKEKKYRSLFERSLDSIFLATMDFKMLDLNDAFLRLFNYSQEEASGLHLQRLFADPADFEYCKTQLREVQYVRDFEVQLVTKSGEKKPCLINCVFIPDQSEDFCCYQGIICDLTLRKKAESELLIAERLSLTGKIARTIAHEVRNPLTNLNLALDQLKDQIETNPSEVGTYTEIIERNSNRIKVLIDDLLHSSKARELQLKPEPINEIIKEMLELAYDRITMNNVKVHMQLSPNLPKLPVDREQIKIALLNIVVNALEAIENETGEISISSLANDNQVQVVITDNGCGIEKDKLDKLFDPFYTSKSGGTGLGLTSTINIISAHRAKIQVDSEPGKGTTFTVLFNPLPD